MTLYEVDEAANRIREEVDSDANIIFGSTFDDRLDGKIRVSVVATGIGSLSDNPFKNREVSGMIGLNKHEIPNKSFSEISIQIGNSATEQQKLDDVTSETKYETEPYEDEYVEKPVTEEKRRSTSFFERFSRSRRKSPETKEREKVEVVREPNDYAQKSDSSEELDIPACFRKRH